MTRSINLDLAATTPVGEVIGAMLPLSKHVG